MWNDKKSLHLSKIFTAILLAALVCFLLAAPKVIGWLTGFTLYGLNKDYYSYFLVSIYSGGALCVYLLFALYILLNNISKGKIFANENTRTLRHISWCCFAGAAICMASAFYYFPWFLLGVAAGFGGLIVRVVKNLLQQAIALKEENELTI